MIDISKYPNWKQSILDMIDELDQVYAGKADEDKAAGFVSVLKKYGRLP